MTTGRDIILHIDDDEINRYAVKKILARVNADVHGVSTASEGWERLSLDPDLIILDVKLPDMNGFELCRRIKSDPRYVMIPVLHMSANFTQTEDKVEGLESGADGYLAQPIEPGVLVATVQSLLRLRRLERDRIKLIGDLQAERDLREKFIATLSHDLRTPLSTAQLAADLIAADQKQTEFARKMASRIVDNIRRADLMIQDLLDVSLLKAGGKIPLVPEEFDFIEFVQSILLEQRVVHGDRFVFHHVGLARLVGYWSRKNLRRAIDNLLSNAVKYGTPSGTITLRLGAVNESLSLSIHNFGNPIPIRDHSRLFHEFIRSSDVESTGKLGWGLGLSVVSGVADAHGGQIELTSSSSEGTVFTLSLPTDCRVYSQGEILRPS